MDRQQRVWNGIKSAIKALKAARDLEAAIENERIRNEVETGRRTGFCVGSALVHDPLGRNLDRVIERLEELIA